MQGKPPEPATTAAKPDMPAKPAGTPTGEHPVPPAAPLGMPKEIGGADGPEPTRYGDWQHKGRVTDF